MELHAKRTESVGHQRKRWSDQLQYVCLGPEQTGSVLAKDDGEDKKHFFFFNILYQKISNFFQFVAYTRLLLFDDISSVFKRLSSGLTDSTVPVSYTHLDVYKRQDLYLQVIVYVFVYVKHHEPALYYVGGARMNCLFVIKLGIDMIKINKCFLLTKGTLQF